MGSFNAIVFALRRPVVVRRGFTCLGICAALTGLLAVLAVAAGWGTRAGPPAAVLEPSRSRTSRAG